MKKIKQHYILKIHTRSILLYEGMNLDSYLEKACKIQIPDGFEEVQPWHPIKILDPDEDQKIIIFWQRDLEEITEAKKLIRSIIKNEMDQKDASKIVFTNYDELNYDESI